MLVGNKNIKTYESIISAVRAKITVLHLTEVIQIRVQHFLTYYVTWHLNYSLRYIFKHKSITDYQYDDSKWGYSSVIMCCLRGLVIRFVRRFVRRTVRPTVRVLVQGRQNILSEIIPKTQSHHWPFGEKLILNESLCCYVLCVTSSIVNSLVTHYCRVLWLTVVFN